MSFLGGGAAIITAAIREVIDVGWPEMISHYRIDRLRVERLGPLIVGIDAHGKSIYDAVHDAAVNRRTDILAQMRLERST